MSEKNVIKKFSLLKGLQLHDAYCWILTAYRNLQQLRCDGFLSLQRMMESKVFRCALAGGNWIDRALLTLLRRDRPEFKKVTNTDKQSLLICHHAGGNL